MDHQRGEGGIAFLAVAVVAALSFSALLITETPWRPKTKRVWTVHRDFSYEFGEVAGVFGTEEDARKFHNECMAGRVGFPGNPKDWVVSGWEVQ